MYNDYTFSDDIFLGTLIETVENHEVVREWSYRFVYATKKSVRSSEHYQATVAGLKPELVFVVRDFEYENEERIRYKGVDYEIIRTYHVGDVYELTVSAKTGVLS